MVYNEENFYEAAKNMGGVPISLSNSNSSINIFDLSEPERTPEYLESKARNLREFLEEANKYKMIGSYYAAKWLKDLSWLDSEPEWKEMATQILQEYADMIEH